MWQQAAKVSAMTSLREPSYFKDSDAATLDHFLRLWTIDTQVLGDKSYKSYQNYNNKTTKDKI